MSRKIGVTILLVVVYFSGILLGSYAHSQKYKYTNKDLSTAIICGVNAGVGVDYSKCCAGDIECELAELNRAGQEAVKQFAERVNR